MSAEEESASQAVDGKEQTLLDHLIELRDRLLHMVVAVLILFLALFPFSEQIFSTVAQPLLALMEACACRQDPWPKCRYSDDN